jgi:hypothetical protein
VWRVVLSVVHLRLGKRAPQALVPAKAWAGTVLRLLPLIPPNMIDDMHDGTVAQGDAWLAREVPKILESDAFNTGGVLFLIVISANAKRGYASATAYDTSSYLKTVQTNLGLEPLPCSANAATVATMDDLFDVPIAAVPRP